MPKKKFYAVKKGKQTGIFGTWDECRRMVQGFSGAVYKSFETEEEAAAYLNGVQHVYTVQADDENQLAAYVDGIYDNIIRRYSFGCVLITPDGDIIRESGSGIDPKSLALRNVAGEMMGAVHAVKWAKEHGYQSIDIRYDYAGIEQWATHGWQAKNELTQQYAAFIDSSMQQMAIHFTKIAAHTGNQYNEEADQLAKKALTQT